MEKRNCPREKGNLSIETPVHLSSRNSCETLKVKTKSQSLVFPWRKETRSRGCENWWENRGLLSL